MPNFKMALPTFQSIRGRQQYMLLIGNSQCLQTSLLALVCAEVVFKAFRSSHPYRDGTIVIDLCRRRGPVSHQH